MAKTRKNSALILSEGLQYVQSQCVIFRPPAMGIQRAHHAFSNPVRLLLPDVVRKAPDGLHRSVPVIIRCRRAILGVRQVFAVGASYPEPSRPSVALAPPSYPEDYPRQAPVRLVDQRRLSRTP